MEESSAMELRRQMDALDEETTRIKEMSLSIDDLQDMIDKNTIARDRLRKKYLEAGYRL